MEFALNFDRGNLEDRKYHKAGKAQAAPQIPKAERCPKNKQLAEKRSFDGNCEILTTIFRPRVKITDITARQP